MVLAVFNPNKTIIEQYSVKGTFLLILSLFGSISAHPENRSFGYIFFYRSSQGYGQ
jgi:hypothetical protein